MKRLKWVLVLSVSALLCTAKTNAQTLSDFRQMSNEQKAQLITDSLTATLSLSSDQSKNVYTMALDGVQQAKQILQNKEDRPGKRKELKSLLTGEETQFKQLLTADQLNVYEVKKQKLISYYRNKLGNQQIIFNAPEM